MSDWWSDPKQPPGAIPFRNKFDAARDPLTARNAIGAVDAKFVSDAITAAGGGGGGAPTTAEYVTAAADATLTAERVLTNTATVTWDFTTAGQAKANAATGGGGNVSNSGTPTVGQYAKWVTATTIQGVAPATVLADIGAQPAGSYQPLDADLTSLAGASATNAIYYRSAANTWATITIGANLTFSGGTLAATVPAAFITAVTAPLSVTGTTLSIDLTAYLTTAAAAAAYQPLDADLTSLAGASATNALYYRSAANTWATVTIGTGLTFTGGTLANSVTAGAPVGAEYITSTADATLTSERVLTDTATVTWDRSTAGQIKANAAGGGGSSVGPPQGRLTLATATPVMTATQSAKTTIYYTPYVGNQIGLYNGSTMVPTTFSELSVATTDTTKSPAAIGASKINDWFVWSDTGTLRIGHGPDWTSDTARSAGTALVMVNGILLNNASITNGPAASRGTYVGTTRSNASSQLDWIFGGSIIAGFFGLWNAYNRVQLTSTCFDTGSWTFSTTLRFSKNGVAVRHTVVSGLAEDGINVTNSQRISMSGGGGAYLGISGGSVATVAQDVIAISVAGQTNVTCINSYPPQVGLWVVAGTEQVDASTTATVNGSPYQQFSIVWRC